MYFKEGPLPLLSKDEEDALRLVIYDVEMAAEEYIVDELERSIRQVWEVALRIGVKHGQRDARQAHVPTAKALEQERIWGFDVGWKLATEECERKASKPNVPIPSLPSLCSVSTVATQTDTLPIPSPKPDTVSAHLSPPPSLPIPELPPELPLAISDLDVDAEVRSKARDSPTDDDDRDDNTEVWHEAPEPSPNENQSTLLPSPSPFVRDFSVLRTGTSRPFASLQRRHKRTHRPHSSRSPPSRTSCTPQTIVLNIYDSKPKNTRTRYHPPFFTPSLYSHPPASTYNSDVHLDWGRDPRLRDLGRALTALGWVRPG